MQESVKIIPFQIVIEPLMEERSAKFREWCAPALVFSILWSVGGCCPTDARAKYVSNNRK